MIKPTKSIFGKRPLIDKCDCFYNIFDHTHFESYQVCRTIHANMTQIYMWTLQDLLHNQVQQ
jgi:hypothetical protein